LRKYAELTTVGMMSPANETLGTDAARLRRPLLLVLSSDVMLCSRLEAPAASIGVKPVAIASLEELREALAGEPSAIVLLDLADAAVPYPEAIDAVQSVATDACCVGIYPHVRDDLKKDAVTRGCTIVLPRSQFFMDIAGALSAARDSLANRASQHPAG
jgi:hypothetical protein